MFGFRYYEAESRGAASEAAAQIVSAARPTLSLSEEAVYTHRRTGSVPEHKFQAGQKVTLAPNFANRSSGGAGYVVTRQLPERGGEFEYRVKRTSEPHERVARESELSCE